MKYLKKNANSARYIQNLGPYLKARGLVGWFKEKGSANVVCPSLHDMYN